jgi:imidazolonepropionase-like amidohydrolase
MHVSSEPGRLDHMGHLRTILQGAGKLQECLQWGTATVAHAAGSPESMLLRDAILSGRIRGCPNLLIGAAITATCGHVLGRSADGPWEIRKAAKELWYMPTLYITSAVAREGKNWPAHMTGRMKAAHPIHCAGVTRAHQLGIRIVTGTDGGPGSIMNEVCLLVGCGLSPMEALVAATRSTADVLGILTRTGTLEAGKTADLFVVDGDPLQDIAILTSRDSIFLVMKNGDLQAAGVFDPNNG